MSEFHMAEGFFFRRNDDDTITVRTADGFDKPSIERKCPGLESRVGNGRPQTPRHVCDGNGSGPSSRHLPPRDMAPSL